MSLIGAHMSVSGGLHKAFARADELNCEALQLFTKSQLRWSVLPLTDEEISLWKEAAAKSKVQEVVAHASYLINLASNGELLEKSKRSLVEEITRCSQLGIQKVVLHPGARSKQELDASLKTLSAALLEVFGKTEGSSTKILLETMAGQGSSIGRSLEEFARVLEYTKGHDRLAFCVDTCHVFAAGYDISTEAGFENFMFELSKNIGLEKVECLHLNDSKKGCASHVDRHEHLGLGLLGLKPFECIIKDKRFEKVPSLLETPKQAPGDAVNLEILRSFRER